MRADIAAGFAHLDTLGYFDKATRHRRAVLGNRLMRVDGRLFELRQYKLAFK